MSTSPPAPYVVGLKPWFPPPLGWWRWLTEPVAAERLAILRIAIALLLLLDIVGTYIPDHALYFGKDSLGSPELFSWVFNHKRGRGNWSLLEDVESHGVILTAMVIWAIATFSLLVGVFSRWAAAVAWVIALSIANINTYVDNAGDQIRTIALFYLMLTPCGAAWSFDAWFWRRHGMRYDVEKGWRIQPRPLLEAPALVHPWALRLLFVQMAWIYFGNGFYKACGVDWPKGNSLYYVLGDLTLTRVSYAQFPQPYWLTRAISWLVLGWEVSFPLLVSVPWHWLADQVQHRKWFGLQHLQYLWRWTREITLLFGVLFHLGIGLTMELGGFPFYMIVLYLPLLPWERWAWPQPQPQPEESPVLEPVPSAV